MIGHPVAVFASFGKSVSWIIQRGGVMQKFQDWWQDRSKFETTALTIASYIFIALGSIDIGRAIYQAVH